MENGQLIGLQLRLIKFPVASFYVTFLIDGQNYQYAIIAVMEGTIEFPEYNQLLQCKSTEICFVRKATLIRAATYEPVKLFIVQFSEQFAYDNLYDIHKGTIAKFFSLHIIKVAADTNTFKVIKKLLLLLYKHHNSRTSVNSPVICKLTFNLLLSCFNELKDVGLPQAQQAANYKIVYTMKFLRMVEEYVAEQHGVKFYAAKLYMTQGNLTRIIKEVTARTPKSFIDESLILKAKAILEDNLFTIYIAAEELGFKSSSAFINFFKFHTGRTPNDYRNRNSRDI